jgi:hypothetical protein
MTKTVKNLDWIRRSLKSTILCFSAVLFNFLTTTAHAQSTAYVWQSADGDPGGIAGTILLDSPSSSQGSTSDVLSITLSDSTGSFVYNNANSGIFSGAPFTWNPTMITEMTLSIVNHNNSILPNFPISPIWNLTADLNDFPGGSITDEQGGLSDSSGAWVEFSSVPEPADLFTFSLLVMAGYAIFSARKRFNVA